VGDLLTVNLDRVYSNGELLDVRVTYTGSPWPARSASRS
jgi:hypothetical protein